VGATEWHIQEARALSATVKRPPSFVEWLVANKARHEREAEIADRIREQRQRYEDRKTREREEERQRIEQRRSRGWRR
jgi:formylglycine-generating enzyme required for sulfatase activity